MRQSSFWQTGVFEFNQGRYWHAHEFWERGWVKLPSPVRESVQANIQLAAVFHLLGKGRERAALSLCRSALSKLETIRKAGGMESIFPRVEIPGIEKILVDIESNPSAWREIAARAEARFVS